MPALPVLIIRGLLNAYSAKQIIAKVSLIFRNMIILYFEFLNILYQRYEYKTTAEIVKFSLCKNKEKKKDIIIQWN